MARPTTKVEIAFNAGVTGTPTWTDVTAQGKVRVSPGIEAGHWRRDEGSTCDRSDLSLILRNDDGRYTPGNTASPHYPNIKKGRRIRVTSVLNGESFPRFTGYIDDWRADWPATVGTISDCRITASSRMAYLGRGTELRSIVEEEMLLDAPVLCYSFAEPSEAVSASDISGSAAPEMTQVGQGADVTFGVALNEISTGATFAGGKNLDVGSTQFLNSGDSFSIHATFRATTGQAGLIAGTYYSPESISAQGITLTIDDVDGKLKAGGISEVGAPLASAARVDDGSVHDALYTFDAVTSDSVLYLDGVPVASNASAFGSGAQRRLVVGGKGSPGIAIYSGQRVGPFTGSVAHVGFYASALSASRAASIATAALTGFAGETSGARIARYAAFAGIPSADLDIDTGQTPALAHIDTTGQTALAAMRAVETTEGGVLFDALDGTLAFHDRAHRYEAAAFGTLLFGGGFFGGGPDGTEFTLSVARGHIASPIAPVLDDQRQVNDMTNSNASGVSARKFDQSSINDHGLYRAGETLSTTDPDEPLLRASWTVTKYAEPLTRVSEVEVNLWNLPDDIAAVVLQAQVGTIFTIADLPANAPASKMHLFVEGREDRISATEDTIVLRTSPVGVSEVFTIGDPVRGLIGGTYPLAY